MRIFATLTLLLLFHKSPGQTFLSIDTARTVATLPAVQLYEKSIGTQSHLYNGSDFEVLPLTDEEHPYFLTYDWEDGNIFFDGYLYRNQGLLYNIATDEVIIEDGATKSEMQLVKDKVGYFSFRDRTFIHLKDKEKIREGFYEVIYDGKTDVFVKHEKNLQERISTTSLEHWYEVKDKIFIYKSGQYYPIIFKKNVLQCFSERAEEVKRHLKQKRLRFKGNREKYCKEAASFFDSLTG